MNVSAGLPTKLPSGKHIGIPRAVGEKWLEALRSNLYMQGFGLLMTGKGNERAFCCLGVLQHVLDGDVERKYNTQDREPRSLPSIDWLNEHGILFNASSVNDCRGSAPYIERFNCTVDGANDGSVYKGERRDNYTFAQIADALEAEFHYTDEAK